MVEYIYLESQSEAIIAPAEFAWSIFMRETVQKNCSSFADLVAEAASCTRCPAMVDRTAVLSELNGSVEVRVMFIGEAPGRKGADRTQIPFSGDQSGKNLERFIASIGLTRDKLFITSAALCNPRTESGANRKPSQSEVANCSGFLRRTIELVNPGVIVTLGSVALDALKRIKWHEFTLKESVGEILKWNDRLLVPIYHPSPQVLASHRREAAQLRDYKVVAQAIKQAGLELTWGTPADSPRGNLGAVSNLVEVKERDDLNGHSIQNLERTGVPARAARVGW